MLTRPKSLELSSCISPARYFLSLNNQFFLLTPYTQYLLKKIQFSDILSFAGSQPTSLPFPLSAFLFIKLNFLLTFVSLLYDLIFGGRLSHNNEKIEQWMEKEEVPQPDLRVTTPFLASGRAPPSLIFGPLIVNSPWYSSYRHGSSNFELSFIFKFSDL